MFCENSNNEKNFDKTRVKLFPDFTRRHLIIHNLFKPVFRISSFKLKWFFESIL